MKMIKLIQLSFILFASSILIFFGLKDENSNFGEKRRFLIPDQNYFYPHDGSYRPGCDYPFEVRREINCVLDLTSRVATETAILASTLSFTRDAATVLAWLSGLLTPNDPWPFCFIALAETLPKMRYSDLRYSPQTQLLFYLYNTTQFEFFPMPESLKEAFDNHDLPDNFEEYSFHSSFLVNFWQQIISISIVLVCIILVTILKKLLTQSGALFKLFKAIQDSLKWNFLIMLFLTYYDDIIFFTSFEVLTLNLDSFVSAASFTACIVSNLLACALLIIIIRIIWSFQGQNNNTDSTFQQLLGLRTQWRNFRVIFARFKTERFAAQLFIPLFIVRICGFNAAIGYLYDYPRIQAIVIFIINLIMFAYVIKTQPAKDKSEIVKYIVQETFVLVISSLILTVGIARPENETLINLSKGLGGLIISLSLTFNAIGLGALAIQVLLRIQSKWYKSKKGKTEETISHQIEKPELVKPQKVVQRLERSKASKIVKEYDIELKVKDKANLSSLNAHELENQTSFDQSSSPLKSEYSYQYQENNPILNLIDEASKIGRLPESKKKRKKVEQTASNDESQNSFGMSRNTSSFLTPDYGSNLSPMEPQSSVKSIFERSPRTSHILTPKTNYNDETSENHPKKKRR